MNEIKPPIPAFREAFSSDGPFFEQLKIKLGQDFTKEFTACTNAQDFVTLAEKYRGKMTEKEYDKLIDYADYIDCLFG